VDADLAKLLKDFGDYKSQTGKEVSAIASAADAAQRTADIANAAVASLLNITYWAAVSDFGTLYVIGKKVAVLSIYCKKTAALAGWASITAALPGGVKAANSMAAALVCEDHPTYEAIALVEGGEVKIQNRSNTAWAASSNGFYIRGQVVFAVA
uniref:hypothetical protein n=1 Tax=uncultured Adlercreutzia sp. TaxID=875803 RepID=UPI0025EDCEA3